MTTNLKAELKQALTRPLIQYLFLFLAVLCVYLPTLWYTFIWDDWDMIGHNLVLRDWRNIPQFFTDPSTFARVRPNETGTLAWRPIRNVYWSLTYILHDLRPAGWHFQQVLLHALCAILLLAFIRRLHHLAAPTLRRHAHLATWIAVLCWAVHPVNTEVVAWLKSADDILACLFGLATLIILLPHNGRLTWTRIAIAALLYPIGLLAKESLPPIAAIYPAIILLLAGGIRPALKNPMAIIATAILVIETLIYLALRNEILGQTAQGRYLAGNFSLMMATMTTAWVRYLQLIFWPFWPTTQSTTYLLWPYATAWASPSVIISLGIILSAVVVATLIGRRSRLAACGFAFFFFAALPIANIVPMMQVLAERFLYFPLMGLTLVLGVILQWALTRPALTNTARAFTIVLPLALIVTTILRLPVWATEEVFVKAQLKVYPNDPRSNFNMAVTLRKAENLSEAKRYYHRVVAVKGRGIGDQYTATIALGQLLMQDKQTTSALQHIKRAQGLLPKAPLAYKIEGGMRHFLGETTAALHAYNEAKQRTKRTDPNLEKRIAVVRDMLKTTTTIEEKLHKP